MPAQDLREKVLSHLKNPLKPLSQATLGEAAKWVEFPTRSEKSQGGLSPEGKHIFQKDKEILEAGEKHKEESRVKIRAVTTVCALFAKEKSGTITPPEKQALIDGIKITLPNGNADFIKTTRKGGHLLTTDFKRMMNETHAAVSKTCPALALPIAKAAKLQQIEEKKEADVAKNIAEMA